MVCNCCKESALRVVPLFLWSPDSSEAYLFCCGIIMLSPIQGLTGTVGTRSVPNPVLWTKTTFKPMLLASLYIQNGRWKSEWPRIGEDVNWHFGASKPAWHEELETNLATFLLTVFSSSDSWENCSTKRWYRQASQEIFQDLSFVRELATPVPSLSSHHPLICRQRKYDPGTSMRCERNGLYWQSG